MHFPTRYGHVVDFENPQPDQIDAKDIAAALSHICRFNGHGHVPYSVAQHSVMVADNFDVPEDRLYALLHDAHEAYTGDLTTPFKTFLESRHKGIIHGIEDKLDKAIHAYFGLSYPLSPALKAEIKYADRQALATEIRDLTSSRYSRRLKLGMELPPPHDDKIYPLPPTKARKLFTKTLKEAEFEMLRQREAASRNNKIIALLPLFENAKK